jgi:hypothetical protein
MSGDEPCTQPDYRATVVRGRLTIVGWHPQLIGTWGPCNAHLRARDRAGIGIADLTVIREPGTRLELIVNFLCGGHRADVRDSIVRWAATLGYGRVWFPDDVVDLGDADIPAEQPAVTRCQVCRSRWEDGDPEFWLTARKWGNFPLACPLCGGDLPQWEVTDARGRAPRQWRADIPEPS